MDILCRGNWKLGHMLHGHLMERKLEIGTHVAWTSYAEDIGNWDK